jgi:hypothetical protein
VIYARSGFQRPRWNDESGSSALLGA